MVKYKKDTLAGIDRGAKVACAEDLGNPYICNIGATTYRNIWGADVVYSAVPQGQRLAFEKDV